MLLLFQNSGCLTLKMIVVVFVIFFFFFFLAEKVGKDKLTCFCFTDFSGLLFSKGLTPGKSYLLAKFCLFWSIVLAIAMCSFVKEMHCNPLTVY